MRRNSPHAAHSVGARGSGPNMTMSIMPGGSSSSPSSRRASFSKKDSKDTSFSDSGPLNVTYELHRMYGTPRAKKFLKFVEGKRSPEPFLCWTALEKLIEEVRDDTLESSHSRAVKVKFIVEDFVLESGANQLGLPMNVKLKMDELYRHVSEDPEFWDGRPLLMLQREAELMLLSDVREHAERYPWSQEDVAMLGEGGLAALVRISTLGEARLSSARRSEMLKRLAQTSKGKTGGRSGTRARMSTLLRSKTLAGQMKRSSEIEECSELRSDARYCLLGKYELTIFNGPERPSPLTPHVTAEWKLLLSQLVMTEHADVQSLELMCPGVGLGSVFFLQFDDPAQLSTWHSALENTKSMLEERGRVVEEKRGKILGLPFVPPPSKASSTQSMMAERLREEGEKKKVEKEKRKELKEQRKQQSKLQDSPTTTTTTSTPAPLLSSLSSSLSDGYRVDTSMSNMEQFAGYRGADSPMLASNTGYAIATMPSNTGYAVMNPNDVQMEKTASGTLLEMIASSSEDDETSSSCSSSLVESGSRRDDFNAIFQECVTRLRELETAPESPETSKMRTDTYVELIGLAEDFVTSAVRYGQIIISEVYLPLARKTIRPDTSVGGVIGGEKFVVNNILFKFALDSHRVFGGNDESAAKVAGLELKGLQAYMSSNTPDLCYPLMALIDYKGFRLVASSLLPLGRGSLRYGSQDAAVTVEKSLPPLTERIEEASASLNLKLHEAGRDRVVMATAVDIEGHLGKDGRYYLLDFSRVFPPVTPNRSVEGSHLFQMFRPEFVKSFTLFPLCSDAYSNFTQGLPAAKEHAEEVDLATMELLNVSVSNFVAELIARMGEEARITGSLENFSLTQLLHSHGINVRYLGEVVRKMGRHPFALVVLAQMVARVVKVGFRRTLRSEMARLRVSIDEPYRIAAKDFLNRVFSNSPESENYWSEDVPQLLNERFQLRKGNWNAFPKNLKKTLFEVTTVNGISFNAKVAIFYEVQLALGLRVAPALVTLLATQPKIYQQASVFDDVDVEDVGTRVKFLDVISNAQGYVFSTRAEEKEKEGFVEAALSLYYRAYKGYQAALGSNPNDSTLLRNCATVMTKIFRLEEMGKVPEMPLQVSSDDFALPNPDPDDPRLYGAQQNYKKAIQANRKNPVYYAAYAHFLRSMGSMEDSEAHYLEALLRDPYSVPILRQYASLLRYLGETEVAERFVLRADKIAHHLQAIHGTGDVFPDTKHEAEESTEETQRMGTTTDLNALL